MPDFSAFSPWPALLVLSGAALVIVFAGTRLAGVADRLADRTAMGEILAGALFVGGSTSLPGAVASMSTAADGYAQLAIGNAIGGLTAQTMFLSIADLVYRRANIEHAAATVTGLTQGVLLVSLLSVALIAAHSPEVTCSACSAASATAPRASASRACWCSCSTPHRPPCCCSERLMAIPAAREQARRPAHDRNGG